MYRKLLDRYKQIPIQVRASFWFLICGFLTKGISAITTPIFTRILSSAEYGHFNVFMSWYGIISVIVSLNLCSGVYSRGLVTYEEKRKEYSSSLQGLCFLLCIVWTIIYVISQKFWNNLFSLTTMQMLSMLAMIWLNSAFQFWSLNQRVDYKYQKLVAITVVVTVAQPALGIFLVLNCQDKVTARILGIVIVELVIYIWLFLIQMLQGKKFCSLPFWKQALAFNLPLIPHYLSMTVLNSADRIMIDILDGTDKAGIYSLAYSISWMMVIFNTALSQTFEPWLYKKIKSKRIEDISDIAIPSFIVIAAVNLLLMIFAPEVISIFAPKEYHDAIWVIPPAAMSVFFMYLYTFFSIFAFYYEETKYVMIATTSGALLNIVLNYIFIQMFGYYAAGYTTLLCYMLFSVLHYHYMKKICHQYLDDAKPYNQKVLIAIIAIFMASGFAILFLYRITWLRYAVVFITIVTGIIRRKRILYYFKRFVTIKKNSER